MRFKERPYPWLVWIVFLTGLILLTGAAAAGASVKLNGVLPGFWGCRHVCDQPGWAVCRLSSGSEYGRSHRYL